MYESLTINRIAWIWIARCLLLAGGIAVPSHQARAAADSEPVLLAESLEQVERRILRESEDFDVDLAVRHVSLLRAVGRDVEAQAFQDYLEKKAAARFEKLKVLSLHRAIDHDAAAEVSHDGPDQQTDRSGVDRKALIARLERCVELNKQTRPGAQLSRPVPSRRLLTVSPVAAEYQINAAGELVEIDVVIARSPAMAWTLIGSIARAKIDKSKLNALKAEDFPSPHCVFWPNGLRLKGNWVRVRTTPQDSL